jgi:hypothetical protein
MGIEHRILVPLLQIRAIGEWSNTTFSVVTYTKCHHYSQRNLLEWLLDVASSQKS